VTADPHITLVEFLRARLDEDEQAATDAAESKDRSWRVATDVGDYVNMAVVTATAVEKLQRGYDGSLLVSPGDYVVPCGKEDGYGAGTDLAIHIARHDPARVLADVEAKRRIVESITTYALVPTAPLTPWHHHGSEVLRLLALPHVGHPDYRAEWAV